MAEYPPNELPGPAQKPALSLQLSPLNVPSATRQGSSSTSAREQSPIFEATIMPSALLDLFIVVIIFDGPAISKRAPTAVPTIKTRTIIEEVRLFFVLLGATLVPSSTEYPSSGIWRGVASPSLIVSYFIIDRLCILGKRERKIICDMNMMTFLHLTVPNTVEQGKQRFS